MKNPFKDISNEERIVLLKVKLPKNSHLLTIRHTTKYSKRPTEYWEQHFTDVEQFTLPSDDRYYEWKQEPPNSTGKWLRHNPVTQHNISIYDVFELEGVLYTVHPLNDGGRLMPVTELPKEFMWIKIIPNQLKGEQP